MARRGTVHPWANLGLALLVAVQIATGLLGLLGSGPAHRVAFWAHAVGAYGIVALLAAKGAIVLTVLRRRPGLGLTRAVLLVLVGLLLATLVSGLVWIVVGRTVFVLGISLVNLHAYLGIALALLVGWHLLDRRWIVRVPSARDRAAFLRLAGTVAAGLVLWQVERTAQALLSTPGSRRRFTGSYERGSHGGAFPATSWLDDDPAPLDLQAWRLTLAGSDGNTREFDLGGLTSLARGELEATLDCTSGWFTTQRWAGVPLAALLAEAGPRDGVRSVVVESVTGYRRRFSLDTAARALLAADVAGAPLSHGHGAPLRLVVPGERGFDWVKWVVRVEVSGRPHLLQTPLPLS